MPKLFANGGALIDGKLLHSVRHIVDGIPDFDPVSEAIPKSFTESTEEWFRRQERIRKAAEMWACHNRGLMLPRPPRRRR